MRTILAVAVLVALASCAEAGRIPPVTGTSPAFDGSAIDSCLASALPQIGNMTLRRAISGPLSLVDSLVNVAPGVAFSFPQLNNVSRGLYTITVDARDTAGNWSCPATITYTATGRPARVADLRIGWLQLADEQRGRLVAADRR